MESLRFYFENLIGWLDWLWSQTTDWQQWVNSLALLLRESSKCQPGNVTYRLRWFLFGLAQGKNIKAAWSGSKGIEL